MIFRKTPLKFTHLAAIGAAGLALAVLPGAIADVATPQEITSQSTKFRVDYTGSLFIFPMGELTVAGEVNDFGYSVRADMQSSGLGKLSKDGGLWSTSTGYYDETGMKPIKHVIKKLNKKGRKVEIDYVNGSPQASIEPRFGSMGQPPATEAERAEAVDAISAIVQMMMTGHKYGDAPCEGSLKVFDGKQRYNLNMRKVGENYIRQSSYRGETVRCHMYMETVSGYDTEDLFTTEEAATPLEVYMANYDEAGLWVPVRFDYRVSGIKVNIKATNIEVTRG